MSSAGRSPWPLRAGGVVAGGLAILAAGLWLLRLAPGLYFKLRGTSPDCPWSRVLSFYSQNADLARRNAALRASLQVVENDAAAKMARVEVPGRRSFWIAYARRGLEAELELLAYLVADHDWVAALHPDRFVHRNDMVIDCGAHVGVFTSKALELGAARVVAVEPSPARAGCLRRTFASEIAAGRVEVQEVAVWSEPGTLQLQQWDDQNSGADSLLAQHGPASSRVDVTAVTLDHLARNLPRLDFLKMDIEGAEREALLGGQQMLRRFHPRVMLDSYHRPEDARFLPELIRRADPRYATTCGPCVSNGQGLVPHLLFVD